MKIKIAAILLLTAVSATKIYAGDPWQTCQAPCTITDGPTIADCWITDVFSSPVDSKIDDQQNDAHGIRNGDITGCPEGAPPPKQTTKVTSKHYECNEYDASANVKWDVFGITAAMKSTVIKFDSSERTLELTGWCQRQQCDTAKRHMRSTVHWEQTADSHWWCGGTDDSGDLTCDRWYYVDRSDTDVSPDAATPIPSTCKATCQ